MILLLDKLIDWWEREKAKYASYNELSVKRDTKRERKLNESTDVFSKH